MQPSEQIIIENAKIGTDSWRLNKVQTDTCRITKPWEEVTFCRTTAIEGYVSHTSIEAADSLHFYVSTSPSDSFNLQIYRLGYYGGQGGRLVQTLGPFAGQTQKTPEDGNKNLIVCRWKKSLTMVIPDDWLSGVYLGKLTTATEGWESHVIFIVKDNRKADFIFQCSDLTWQSYNRWPAWRSLYDWTRDGAHTPWYTDIGPEVSFDRPYSFYLNSLPATMMAEINGSGEFLLWEFPLAFWMEKEGYDVTYISNLDTHWSRNNLLRAKTFLSVGHDEYWTRTMLENVTYARDQGINIIFLSGNSLSGEIYLNPSPIGADRVFGRMARFADEQLLMGAKSYGVGLADWICTKPQHWIYDGTDMKLGDRIPDLIGWEYHGYPLPDIEGLTVLAEGGLSGANDTSRYAATYYENSEGTFVFNAATCWWSMLLSSPPGFPFPQNPRKLFTDKIIDFRVNDPRVIQMTKNLFARGLADK